MKLNFLRAIIFTCLCPIFLSAASAQTNDCNHNSIPDVCDINPSANPSLCNSYCNVSPTPCGKSADCNQNNFPDECDSNIAATEADTCPNAQGITPLANGVQFSGSTVGKNPEGSTTCGKSGGNGSPSVYYTYTPDQNGTLTASLCGSDYDTVLSIHTPSCPTSSTAGSTLACNDDSGVSGCGQQSIITMPVVKGQTYVLRIAGARSQSEGNFKLVLDGPPSTLDRDDCDQDGVLNSCELDTDGDRVPDDCDNCKQNANIEQTDSDNDSVGDACDQCVLDPSKVSPGACGCGTPDSDGDGDGTADCADLCPNDSAKNAPGSCGCGTSDIDTDQDGSADCIDQCVNDSSKTAPGICGCGVADTDSDGDGTPNCLDSCAQDPNKTQAGICGCGTADTDSDGDGTANCNDACANDPNKIAAGLCGCGTADTDSDGDGTPNCYDACANDPGKIAAGICGCGTADTDTDGDGTANCNDSCVNDPGKTSAGICGCGTPDTDSDGDGTADCLDLCPNDSGKTAAGICGCGTPDTDSDGDGTANCNDLCSNDPAKTTAGICGCGTPDTDSDNDGTANCQDSCQFDANKVAPGICGCGTSDVDGDGDNTADCNDLCAQDPNKAAPGVCGCGTADTDSDNDGTADCNDLCKNDSTKVAPGTCGCGTPDTDTDGDGTADCQDSCLNDPAKTVPGTCGCGTADTDSDSDGTPNCLDSCPSDSQKTSAGLCGCGTSDLDSDSDGTPNCQDACANDAGKTSPGTCGCGTPDTDSDADGVKDCQDQCANDKQKTQPGTCGCGVADTDQNQDGVIDCICSGLCSAQNPGLDEDGDGVPNCRELSDGTAPCDSGSFIPQLQPAACAGPNGFFSQVNVATIVNHLATPLFVKAEYRDLFGILKSSVSFTLGAFVKRDLIVNDMGLEKDSYGTFCVYTNAATDGAWSGGITLYKKEFQNASLALGLSDKFDYALFYPFTNPVKKTSFVPLNTNVLGTDGQGTVANWVRLTDAITGDGKGLKGVIHYTDYTGNNVGSDSVNLPDGGRFDFGGHEKVGFRGIGVAEFVPENEDVEYYIESSRYFYKGVLASGSNFYTAFTLPSRPPTGAATTGRISNMPNEVSVVEMINGRNVLTTANLKVFSLEGNLTASEQHQLAPKGANHRVVTASLLASNTIASAEVSGPPESVAAISLVYRFASNGELLYAYAPAFAESAGLVQFTDFNSFIGHKNTLELFNSSGNTIQAAVSLYDYLGAPLPGTNVTLAPKGSASVKLVVPADTYGTVVVDSGSALGLIVRNDVSREGEYLLSFRGR